MGRTNESQVFFRGLGSFGRVLALYIWSVWYYRVLNILIWYYFCPLYGIHIREYLMHVGDQHCWALEQRGDALVTCWKRLAALYIISTHLPPWWICRHLSSSNSKAPTKRCSSTCPTSILKTNLAHRYLLYFSGLQYWEIDDQHRNRNINNNQHKGNQRYDIWQISLKFSPPPPALNESPFNSHAS